MQEIIAKLTTKDDKFACTFTDKIIAESRECDTWYEYFDAFASLLNHPKSLVRNRALHILPPMPGGTQKTVLMPSCRNFCPM